MEHSSGVGVLDKAVLLLDVIEAGPVSLAGLVARTGLSRATAHRLAVALESHRLLSRDGQGRFVLGPRLLELGGGATEDPLLAHAGPVLSGLRDSTGESAQLYVRRGDGRVCVAAAERGHGLRDTVPVGAVLPMTRGVGRPGAGGLARPRRAGGAAASPRPTSAGPSPRCGAAAGRTASASGRPAWRRSARRCGPRTDGCSPRSRSAGRPNGWAVPGRRRPLPCSRRQPTWVVGSPGGTSQAGPWRNGHHGACRTRAAGPMLEGPSPHRLRGARCRP